MYMSVFVLSCFIHIQLFATLWTVAHWAPLSMGFSRQEYWSGLPCLPPGDLLNPRIEPMSLISAALAGGFFTTRAIWEAPCVCVCVCMCFVVQSQSHVHLFATHKNATFQASLSFTISQSLLKLMSIE